MNILKTSLVKKKYDSLEDNYKVIVNIWFDYMMISKDL